LAGAAVKGRALLLRVALVAFATPAVATQDGWPAIYDVTGVAEGDVLNIRERPDASSPVVGRLSPGMQVEVIRPNDRQTWGLVNEGDRPGWVALGFMTRRPGQWDGAFPEVASCFGTEPFWTLVRDGDGLSFNAPDGTQDSFAIIARAGSENRRDSFHMIAEGVGGPAVAMLATEACSDGMSDREFGISVQLLLGLGAVARQLSGCCTRSAE
jgi:uncharacterized membrane protein